MCKIGVFVAMLGGELNGLVIVLTAKSEAQAFYLVLIGQVLFSAALVISGHGFARVYERLHNFMNVFRDL
ncbi:hypothetical protein NCCP2716_12960 [Sporosarcina sp. NCCP-2716]|nr:hypothetical protein NCCP2716_12960 [Sporosarcina sp. NCCP-2716]